MTNDIEKRRYFFVEKLRYIAEHLATHNGTPPPFHPLEGYFRGSYTKEQIQEATDFAQSIGGEVRDFGYEIVQKSYSGRITEGRKTEGASVWY